MQDSTPKPLAYTHLARSIKQTITGISCALATTLSLDVIADDIAQVSSADNDVEVVVVKGQKIDRTLQDTASSVSVFTKEQIDEQNFITLGDILNQTANVSSGFNDTVITIRGVRNIGASGDVTSDVSAFYVDGVFLPRSLFASGGLDLWDIDSAEVFRGPQSTVQGRNALAGAVVLSTVDPSYDFEGRAQVLYGDYGTMRASGAVTVPVIDNELAVRFSFDENRSDGFITNPTLNTDESDRSENTTFRAKALWEPAWAPDLRVEFSYTSIDGFKGDGRVDEALFPQQRVTFENVQSVLGTDSEVASLVVDYDLNDTWTLTSVSAHTQTDEIFFVDGTRNELGGQSVSDFTGSDEIFSQELRASFETERMRGILGVFLFKQTGDTQQDATSFVQSDFALPDPVTLSGLLFGTPTPNAQQIGQGTFIRQQIVALQPEFPVLFDRTSDITIDNYAIFGEVDIDLSDKWTATLGLRYDRETIAQEIFDSTDVPLMSSGDATVDTVFAALANQFSNAVRIGDIDNDFDAWLPKAVFTYNWNDSVSTSFSYQRGYRAGGLSVNVFRAALSPEGATQSDLEAAGVVNSFEPEFTNNYEIAFRSQFWDNQATLNANLFLIDYTDQQINVQLSSNPLDTLTENVGQSELYGLEIDFTHRVNDQFQWGANIGYVETEFTEARGVLDDTIGGGLDLTGLEFTYAPQITAGAYGRYEWDSGWFLNGRIRYTDESFTLFDNNPLAVNDSFVVADFIGGYQTATWRAELFVNNAFDRDFLTASFGPANNAIAIAGAPRVVGGRFVVDF